ncbi:MAG: DUF1919 domain-containing protein [Bacteroidota bacterium]|nr:DUF1919 domain-containing protein [Bacteroidota bacterium]
MSNNLKKYFRQIIINHFRKRIGAKKFCIISNDCWGAEIYKLLNRPYNTPFVGLMMMSPCYIKMLADLKYYLSLPLNFREYSRYPEMQQIESGIKFPLAVLGDTDIEIHFMHFRSENEVREKWARRINRIDWQHLFIKYDCGKDYAERKDVDTFVKMVHLNKLAFGNETFGNKEVIQTKKYSNNGKSQFRNCFLDFNPIEWLNGNPLYKNVIQKKIIGSLAYKFL